MNWPKIINCKHYNASHWFAGRHTCSVVWEIAIGYILEEIKRLCIYSSLYAQLHSNYITHGSGMDSQQLPQSLSPSNACGFTIHFPDVFTL